MLRGLKKTGDGCGGVVAVGERVAGEWDWARGALQIQFTDGTGGSRGAVGRLMRTWPRTCRILGALGHVERAKILAKLLEGPATYRALQHLTKLKLYVQQETERFLSVRQVKNTKRTLNHSNLTKMRYLNFTLYPISGKGAEYLILD